jgi:hypothetical protein
LVCNNSSIHHDRNCPSHKNNALKGASNVNQQPTQLVFNQSEVNILGKSLESLRNFVIKNQSQYQNPQDIIKELTTAHNILSARRQNNNNKSNLKGASNICNKKEYLTDLLKQFNLI